MRFPDDLLKRLPRWYINTRWGQLGFSDSEDGRIYVYLYSDEQDADLWQWAPPSLTISFESGWFANLTKEGL